MKKITRFIASIVLSAALLLPSAAFAARDDVVPDDAQSLTLREVTPLNSWAALAPQTVRIIGVASLNDVWIDTFVGPVRVRYNPETMSIKKDDDSLIGHVVIVNKEAAPLYNLTPGFSAPAWNTKTGFALAPQYVRPLDQKGNYVKIQTWVGEKWLEVSDVNDVSGSAHPPTNAK
jgi:hypothetical protein